MIQRIVSCLLVLLLMSSYLDARELFSNMDQDNAAQTVLGKQSETTLASVKYSMQTFSLNYLMAKDMVETVRTLLAEGETVSANEGINTIIVRADQKTIDRLDRIIRTLDVPPLQVQVESKIIEVKSGSGDTTNPSSFGFDWKIKNETNPNDYVQLQTRQTLLGTAQLGLYAQLLSGNVDAYLSALERSIGYDLVASPWITAINHREAAILIGSKYGYKQSIVTLTSTVQEIKFLEVGTKLTFTPHISDTGYIVMDMYPSISEGRVENELPQENTTETKNQVLVKDGQTIVIGGLTKNYNNQVRIGVPILSHIPLLGALFRRTELVSEKRDIMIIITPHIVTPEFLQKMNQKAKNFEALQEKKNIENATLIE